MSFYWNSSKYSSDRRKTPGILVFLSLWQYKAGGFPSECAWLKTRLRQQRWETKRKCQWEQRCQSQVSSASWWKPKINRSFQVSNSTQGAEFWRKTIRNKVLFQEVCKNTPRPLSNADFLCLHSAGTAQNRKNLVDAINHSDFYESSFWPLALRQMNEAITTGQFWIQIITSNHTCTHEMKEFSHPSINSSNSQGVDFISSWLGKKMLGIKAPLFFVFVCLRLATVSWRPAPLWACWFSFSVGTFVAFSGTIRTNLWDEHKSKSVSRQPRNIIHFSTKELWFAPQIPFCRT